MDKLKAQGVSSSSKSIFLASIFLFIFILNFNFISCQEETGGFYSKQGAEYMDSGVIVNTLIYDTAKINKNLTIYMIPYEVSGKTLDNSSVSCRLGVTSPDGSRLLLLSDDNGDFLHISDNDIWVGVIPGTFLNETGKFLYNWDCQESIKGGYLNGFIEITNVGTNKIFNFYILFFLIAGGIIILGFSIKDGWTIVLGSFTLILFGLFIILFGIDSIKDPIYTWSIGLITIMVGSYIGIRSALDQIE